MVGVQSRFGKRTGGEKSKLRIFIKRGATIPTRAHETDAGLDLYCMKGGIIWPWGHKTFDTGVHFALPFGTYGKIESKSGLNINHNIVSCGGTVDEPYRGSVRVKLYNLGWIPYRFKAGQKVAQIVIMDGHKPELELVNNVNALGKTDRGDRGFGSTGK